MMSKLISIGDVAYLLYPLISFRWMAAFSAMHGRLKYLIKRRERLAVENNLLTIFDGVKSRREINLLTRRFFEYKQLRMLLLFTYPKLSPALKETLFPIEGWEYVQDALSQNKGVILIGSHLNAVITLIGKEILRAKGFDVRIAMPTEELPYLPTRLRKRIDRLSQRQNEIHLGMFHAQFNIRPLVRCLAQNAAVILQGDGEHSAGFVEVELLGRQILLTTGAMSIARMTRSPVIPFFVTGSPPDGLKICLEEPISLEKSEDSKRDLKIMVSKYARRLDYHLSQNIACWEHLLIPHALDRMNEHFEKPLRERYKI